MRSIRARIERVEERAGISKERTVFVIADFHDYLPYDSADARLMAFKDWKVEQEKKSSDEDPIAVLLKRLEHEQWLASCDSSVGNLSGVPEDQPSVS